MRILLVPWLFGCVPSVSDGVDDEAPPTDTAGPEGDADGDGVPLAQDCDDLDASVITPTATWPGDVEDADWADLCASGEVLRVEGDIYPDPSLTSLEPLSCVCEIGGSLGLMGMTSLTSLHGLERLRVVDELVLIARDGGALTSLEGLERLSSVQDLHLSRLTQLGDLSALAGLRAVEHTLALHGLSLVERLDGLEGLSATTYLSLGDAPALVDLTALSGLASVTGTLHISETDALASLDGLDGLSAVGGSLELEENGPLVDLGGLSGLRTIGNELRLRGNADLSDLSALYNLESVGGDVTILDNPALPAGEAEALVDELETVGGHIEIE